jgi:hypothetical protein
VSSPVADCSMTCADNGTEYCGAGGYLNLYQRNGTYISPSSSSTTPGAAPSTTGTFSSTTVPGSAPTATGPAIKQIIGNWVFQGCWTEATNGRALASTTYANDGMTLESCAAFCKGSLMFGVEYGRECMSPPFFA